MSQAFSRGGPPSSFSRDAAFLNLNLSTNEGRCWVDIRFDVSSCDETGGFVARWDDPSGGGICTQGESIADLEAMLRDAVGGYFTESEKPLRLQLHFVEDPLLVLA